MKVAPVDLFVERYTPMFGWLAYRGPLTFRPAVRAFCELEDALDLEVSDGARLVDVDGRILRVTMTLSKDWPDSTAKRECPRTLIANDGAHESAYRPSKQLVARFAPQLLDLEPNEHGSSALLVGMIARAAVADFCASNGRHARPKKSGGSSNGKTRQARSGKRAPSAQKPSPQRKGTRRSPGPHR